MHYKLRKLGDDFYAFTVWDKDEPLFLYTGRKENIKNQASDLGFYGLKEFRKEKVYEPELEDRNNEIIKLRREGLTLKAIGDRYNLTAQSISSICKRNKGSVSNELPNMRHWE